MVPHDECHERLQCTAAAQPPSSAPPEFESLSGGGEHARRRTKWEGDGYVLWALRYLPTLCLRTIGHGRRASLQRKRAFAAAVFLGGLLLLVLGLIVRLRRAAPHRPSEEDRARVFSLEWSTLIPELVPVMAALRACGQQVRESFDDIQVQRLYACDASEEEGPFSPDCVKEAKRHLEIVRHPSDEGLKWYHNNEQARALRWPHGRPGCKVLPGSHRGLSDKNILVGGEWRLGGANASVWMGDFAPCATGQDRYIVYLRHNGSQAAAADAPAARVVSRAELEDHTGEKVLVVIDGLVLDVSSFLEQVLRGVARGVSRGVARTLKGVARDVATGVGRVLQGVAGCIARGVARVLQGVDSGVAGSVALLLEGVAGGVARGVAAR